MDTMTPIKTLHSRVPGLVAHIYRDPDPHYDFDTLGTITYNARARYVLGVVPKTREEDDEIARKIALGEYIGVPVWSYVHSGATVRAAWQNPFSCPWDSGRSGWVYVPMEKALKEYGRKLPSKKFRLRVRDQLIKEVEVFNMYLTGDVYGYEIEHNGHSLDSCWNYSGYADLEKELENLLAYHAKQIAPMAQMELPIDFVSP